LEDIPAIGVLFRPLPQQESSLQQNVILGQTVIYPTLFDLMGLRWAPAVSDLDPLRLLNEEFVVEGRHQYLEGRVYDHASSRVDDFMQIPEAMRRPDLYRPQATIPHQHPNGYEGPGLGRATGRLQEGYQLDESSPTTDFYPSESPEGSRFRVPRPLPQMYDYAPQGAALPQGVEALPFDPNASGGLMQPGRVMAPFSGEPIPLPQAPLPLEMAPANPELLQLPPECPEFPN
jgi:hypothetical protein